jgi:ABC-type Fe3+ transport system permease subunit
VSYGAPPPPPPGQYGQPGGYGPPPVNHGSATTALVLGILSLVCCGVLGIPAFVVGRRAEREIRASEGRLTGEGMAKAGWICGLIGMILTALLILFYVVLFLIAGTEGLDPSEPFPTGS